MKLLVTGATGFVGYNFVKKAVANGDDITCIVRANSQIEKLQTLGVDLFIADLLSIADINTCFTQLKPEVVVHCAGCVVGNTDKQFQDANVESTRNICQASLAHNVERLIYLSSVDVNSANVNLPIKENMPYLAVNTYGQSKIDAEKVVCDFREQGLKTVTLRPTTIIGEDEPHGINQLLPLILKRRIPIPGLSKLNDQIHIVYIGNVVHAIELALVQKAALQETFNICDAQTTNIRTMLKIMVDELNCKPPRVIPSWIVNILLWLPPLKRIFNSVFKNWAYDISHASELLHYQPEISSEEGMRRTVRKWKDNQKKIP